MDRIISPSQYQVYRVQGDLAYVNNVRFLSFLSLGSNVMRWADSTLRHPWGALMRLHSSYPHFKKGNAAIS